MVKLEDFISESVEFESLETPLWDATSRSVWNTHGWWNAVNVGVFADSEQRAAPRWAVSPCRLNRVSRVRGFYPLGLWEKCRT